MKKASPQTGRVKVTSLHGFIYENAARCPVGRRNSQEQSDPFTFLPKYCKISVFKFVKLNNLTNLNINSYTIVR